MIASLDIGTSAIKAALAEITNGQDINILGISHVSSSGLKKGNIVDIEATAKAINTCLDELERLTGVQIDKALVGFSGASISVTNNRAVVAIGNSSYEITNDDRDRVIQSASNISLPPDRIVIQRIERQFLVDGFEGVKDPVGMVASRLEAEVNIITAASAAIQNIQRSTARVDLQVEKLYYNPLLVSKTVLLPAEKEAGVILVDFGAGITEVALYRGGSMVNSSVLPVGDEYITRDLAIVLKTSIEEAKRIKEVYGVASSELLQGDNNVAIKNIKGMQEKEVSLRVIADIINARVVEIMDMIYEEILGCGSIDSLPGGIVISGGGAQLTGLVTVMENHFGIPVRLGLPENFRGLPTEFNRPQYAAVLGGVIYAARYAGAAYQESKTLFGIFDKINYWIKDLFS